jgi:hypothetical protein
VRHRERAAAEGCACKPPYYGRGGQDSNAGVDHWPPRKVFERLKTMRILSEKASAASADLKKIRDRHAHARAGHTSQEEAKTAIGLLHVLVEDTVSIFKEFDFVNGSFVRKTAPPEGVD